MLRAAYPRLAPRVITPQLVQAVSLASRRTFFTAPAARFPQVNEYKTKEDGKGIPTEGLHYKDEVVGTQVARSDYHTANKAAMIPTGDWVLFHPVYTPGELESVSVFYSAPKKLGDKIAMTLVKAARWGFDLVSGYKSKPIPENHNMTIEQLRAGGYVMKENEWLMRIIFLESVAAVPGMVAATLRHLRSLRLMKRDAGWIHTLLEEAENERMHLMTFMSLKQPSVLFRALILAAQGIFYNAFFLGYILSPKSAHRFVGYLEEEAVSTYTRAIAEIEAGRLPEWSNMPAPGIAIDYWRLPADATMLEVIKCVRADESTHRFVNHSFANLEQKEDLNPFAIREPDMFVKGVKPGFTRAESAEFVDQSRGIFETAKA